MCHPMSVRIRVVVMSERQPVMMPGLAYGKRRCGVKHNNNPALMQSLAFVTRLLHRVPSLSKKPLNMLHASVQII
jgi:hypothetical protein